MQDKKISTIPICLLEKDVKISIRTFFLKMYNIFFILIEISNTENVKRNFLAKLCEIQKNGRIQQNC